MELSIHFARYRIISSQVAGKRVLDIACGEGWGSFLMAKYWGAESVHAIDNSTGAIEKAKQIFPLPNIHWTVMDAQCMDDSLLKAPYDIIISIETIEHLPDPKSFLEKLSRIIIPDGIILISCPNDHWYYGPGRSKNPHHLNTYTFDEFKELTESVLGKAKSYYFGTKINGFAAVPIDHFRVVPESMTEALNRFMEREAVEILPSPDLLPEVKDALFYMGSWGKTDLSPSFSISPIHPEKRFPLDHLRPPDADFQGPKKKITLVADTPGWAYDNISQNIRKYLGDLFEIDIVYVVNYSNYTEFFIDLFCTRDSQFIHIFWREYFFVMLRNISLEDLRTRIDPKIAAECFASKVITTSIYDHLYLSDEEVSERQDFFSFVDAYSVGSQRLKSIYDGKMNVPPDLVIEDGVDTDVYQAVNPERFSEIDRDFLIGWAGNSQWHFTKTEDPKGVHTILKPAIEMLKGQGFKVRGVFADVSVKRRPRSEMPKYYNSIDVLVCSSAIEGTPNPVLEAMACGVPVISTDVGIIPQLFGRLQRKFILQNRSAEEMAEKLRSLIQDRPLMLSLSKENLEITREWRWEHHMPKWMLLFKVAGLRNDSRAIYRKRRLFLSYLQKLPEKEKKPMNEFIKKVAFRIYPDSIFWKNAKAKILNPFRRSWNKSE